MNKDIRDAFFDRICEYAFQDKNVVIVADDIDIFSLHKFKKQYPERFLNPGVAEQQIINLAAGLAATGKKVIVCGIASFITLRCLEQIKVNICSMNLPVAIVGLGVGLSFSLDGPTHHAVSDVAVMKSIPEIHIFNPNDGISATAAAEIAYNSKSPCYVRIDKGIMPNIYDNNELDIKEGYTEIMPVSDITILSTGYATHLAKKIINNIGLYDVYCLKPINKDFVLSLAKSSKGLITLEEHACGGLFSIVAETLSNNNIFIPVKGVSLKDGQYLQYGSREWLLANNGLSSHDILAQINEFKKAITSD